MKRRFIILFSLGVIGATSVLTYAFALQHKLLAGVNQPLSIIALASIIQSAILIGIAVFIGLKLSASLQLKLLASGEPEVTLSNRLRPIILWGIISGILTGLIIYLIDSIFSTFLPELTNATTDIAIWKKLFASLYGGFAEEILMRLFLLSLFAWLLSKVFKVQQPKNNAWVMWLAIIISAIIFGLAHLPATATLVAITPLVIFRAILLNGIGGIIFGWLYWKKGLAYSMSAHLFTDILILVLLPLLLQ